MSRPAIAVHNLGKRYQLGETQPFDLLRERINHAVKRLVNREPQVRQPIREFWAIRDVTFDVQEGEVLGVIGHNGAGKSTILKILSRITDPTEGGVRLRGRVASLLEVGTGFHKELTGRENVFLNGAILGMRRAEIRAKFDEIVSFAGVDQFIDTPVKRYSSGMTVRLAFAVAAHLDPEILLIDEVLAVGDADFQRRCLGKMGDVAKSGRTIVFVSHNMAAVEGLCDSVALLSAGRLVERGEVERVLTTYAAGRDDGVADVDLRNHPSRSHKAGGALHRFRVVNLRGEATQTIALGEPCTLKIDLMLDVAATDLVVGVHFYSAVGQRVCSVHSAYQYHPVSLPPGPVTATCTIDRLDLMPGSYHLVIGVATAEGTLDRIDPAATLHIVERDVFGTGRMAPHRDGVFLVRAEWSVVGMVRVD